MKQQISRLSPHQNGKVFAVLMTVTSLIFLVPMFLIASAFMPEGKGMPVLMMVLLPAIYLVVGYLGTALACAIYNLVAKVIGGIEFEARPASTGNQT